MNQHFSALVLAIVYRAALDMKSDNVFCVSEAKKWLLNVGLHWCQIIGVSEKDLSNWQASNFSLPGCSHRNWRY